MHIKVAILFIVVLVVSIFDKKIGIKTIHWVSVYADNWVEILADETTKFLHVVGLEAQKCFAVALF